MSPPHRRSARLRGSSATPAQVNYYSRQIWLFPAGKITNASLPLPQTSASTPNRLASLAERDETPTGGARSNLDAVLSSPIAPTTPATAGRIKPSAREMHPSKAHKSTTAEGDSGLCLGFTDIKPQGNNQPSGVTQQTPTKAAITPRSFEFQFARPGPQLGPEAQRMMDGLREQALHIKAQLAAEREEEKRKNGESSADGIGGRKFAQPKGKAGRFSDVHMAEFKKMDSIAGHPSSFRAQPNRLPPPTTNLKRTQSKAKLDDREGTSAEQVREKPSMERLENTAPAKRARKHISDDTSSARPVSRDGSHTETSLPPTPGLPRSQSNMPSIMTPTKSSLSRVASIKHPATQIPTLSRTPSRPNLGGTPRSMTKSATTSNLNAHRSASKTFIRTPGRLDRVRSILRYPSSSKKATSASSIPTLARSPSRPNLEKSLPSVPTTPFGLDRDNKSVKRVNFSSSTANPAAIANSPSPIKSGIPRSTSKINLGNASHSASQTPVKEVKYPSLAGHPDLVPQFPDVKYPSMATPRPLPEPPRQVKTEPRPLPSVPGTFSFRSDHTIDFGASPKGFGSSPGQSSVRQVRSSVLPGTIPGGFSGNKKLSAEIFPSVPQGTPNKKRRHVDFDEMEVEGNKENIKALPSVPHGMSNKKRRRADSDDEKEPEHSPKKHKASVPEGPMLVAPRLMAGPATPKKRTPSPIKKKGVLSLSRLNMLARPKMRK